MDDGFILFYFVKVWVYSVVFLLVKSTILDLFVLYFFLIIWGYNLGYELLDLGWLRCLGKLYLKGMRRKILEGINKSGWEWLNIFLFWNDIVLN